MASQRKNYSTDFKLEVARMIVDQGLSVPQVALNMEIGETAARRWAEQYRAEQNGQPGIIIGEVVSPHDKLKWRADQVEQAE